MRVELVTGANATAELLRPKLQMLLIRSVVIVSSNEIIWYTINLVHTGRISRTSADVIFSMANKTNSTRSERNEDRK